MYRALLFILVAATAAAPQDAAVTNVQQQPLLDETFPSQSYRSSIIENIPLTFPRSAEKEIADDILDSSDDNESRNVRAEPTTDFVYDTTTEIITEKYEPKTTVYEVKTKAPPKFYSKLSYFEKAKDFNSVVTNLVERPGRRRFRSKCRCENISNCPKLQISVGRCPNDQFLCCF